jgi:hypothetical protein
VTEIDASFRDRVVLRTWKGGYSTLMAELSGTKPSDDSLARVKATAVKGERDRG